MTDSAPLRRLIRPLERTNRPDLQVLSVYREHGVVPKSSRSDNFNKTPEDVSRYLHVRAGDLVVNKMKAWSGSVAVSQHEGIVSADYLVCGLRPGLDARYLHHLLRSPRFVTEMRVRSVGIRPNQERLYWDDLAQIQIPTPAVDEQRRIADFLDDRVTRIDQIITARRQQIDRLAEAGIRASYEAVSGGGVEHRRPSGLDWLGDVPAHWGVLPVGMEFHVDLGKMLDEKRQTGTSTIRYLRNTNVQWDRVDTADLKEMDVALEERDRYCVRAGDLLICEGGQPGRAAIWTGDISPLAYQKALHRARSRGRSLPGWLLECLRVAVHLEVFNIGAGQTTIGHLTNEQLRAQRFPFPPRAEQEQLLGELEAQRERILGARHDMAISIDTLSEYKQSLITAAVSGELDVSTAGSRILG